MKENYCTLFPDKTFALDWKHCCKAHDEAYELQVDRGDADKELFKCVYDSTDNALLVVPALLVASVMYLGVRAFGRRFYRKAE